MAGEGAMFKFLRPRLRPQPVDIQAAGLWGVAATTTALWLIQPFDWLKRWAALISTVDLNQSEGAKELII